MPESIADSLETRAARSSWSTAPIVLGPNQPLERPYRGGAGIARFRGLEQLDEFTPEDFVASTTEVHAGGGVGLTRLADGTLLRDAIQQDPVGFLGAEHVERFGADTMLLMKLLDTGERLFVHFHPDDAFAIEHGLAPRGKTEAWIIVDVEEGVDGYAHLGFNRAVSEVEVEHWFREQDVPDMLGAMHRVELSAGDTLLVPAGVPHAIGAGVTLVELQQPTDLSILLEYQGYHGLDEKNALLGLDLATAMAGLDRSLLESGALSSLGSSRPVEDEGRQVLFPTRADQFFRAERIRVVGERELDPAFSILVVESGSGEIESGSLTIPVTAGTTVVVPFGAGALALRGEMTVLRGQAPIGEH